MKRLCRLTFGALAALSLLISLAAAALWARQRVFTWSATRGLQTVAIQPNHSAITIKWITRRPPVLIESNVADAGMHLQNDVKFAVDMVGFTDGTTWHEFGLYANLMNNPRAADILPELSQLTMISLPHWFVVFSATILPLLWVITIRRRRLATPGHCTVCGYDLRATRERCPECGMKVN